MSLYSSTTLALAVFAHLYEYIQYLPRNILSSVPCRRIDRPGCVHVCLPACAFGISQSLRPLETRIAHHLVYFPFYPEKHPNNYAQHMDTAAGQQLNVASRARYTKVHALYEKRKHTPHRV